MEDKSLNHNLLMRETIRHSKMNAEISSIKRASQNDLSRIEEKIRKEISCLPKEERTAVYSNIKEYFEFWVKILEKEVQE
ncbi:MAG: hypothetical protein K0S04_3262 [Herbinix sp.]|jgi:hypothetical protein|nr:hypothetical protein [Herbinix sp.]